MWTTIILDEKIFILMGSVGNSPPRVGYMTIFLTLLGDLTRR